MMAACHVLFGQRVFPRRCTTIWSHVADVPQASILGCTFDCRVYRMRGRALSDVLRTLRFRPCSIVYSPVFRVTTNQDSSHVSDVGFPKCLSPTAANFDPYLSTNLLQPVVPCDPFYP
jgi:hypothetical protein